MARKTVNLKLVADYTPEPDPPPANAEISLLTLNIVVDEGQQFNFNVFRAVRTDQVIDVDWAFTNVSVTPISGTIRFEAGTTTVITQVDAQVVDTSELGDLTLSNPRIVSGDPGDPILVSPFTTSVTINDLGSFLPNNPTNYVPRVNGVAGWGMDSAFGTTDISQANGTARIMIYRVATLNDVQADGSFRYALQWPDTQKTVIVFDKSGWCDLTNDLDIEQGNKTIAYQTAPSPGFATRGDRIRIRLCDNLLFWHMRHAMGESPTGLDAVQVNDVNNLAMVNCLIWFGDDEVFSGWNNSNTTIHQTIIGHCMYGNEAIPHNFGTLWFDSSNITWTRSVFAHSKFRAPRMNAENFDYFNNIIANFNGQEQTGLFGNWPVANENDPTWQHTDNLHHNFWLAGPDTLDASEALGIVAASGDEWEGGQVYYPDGQSGRPLLNKYRGGFTRLRNDVGATIVGTINNAAVAHGSVVTPTTSWTDAQMVERILEKCGARPSETFGYQTMLRDQIANMETGVGDQGSWCGNSRTDVYTGDGTGYDTLVENTHDVLAVMENDGVFANASIVSTGNNYRLYDFPVDANGFTDLDTWLNLKSEELMDAQPLADYYVQDTGSDSASGKFNAPFATLEKALSVCTGGEIIQMQKAGGGTWTYAAQVTFNEAFSEGNEVTVRVRTGDRINFYPGAIVGGVWEIENASYLILDGSFGEIYVGDSSLWSGTNGGTDNYPYNYSLKMANSHHIDFQTINFSGGDSSQAVRLENTCNILRFKNCKGTGHGTVRADGTHLDDGIGNGATNVLFEDCDFSAPFGGHNSMGLFGYKQVVRRCKFDMTAWWDGTTDQGPDAGYRAFSLSINYDYQPWAFSRSPWGPHLIEDCWIEGTGHNGSTNNASFKLGAKRAIFRYNYIVGSRATAPETHETALPAPATSAQNNSAEFVRSYNNTNHDGTNINYGTCGTIDTGDNLNLQNKRIVNNLYSDMVQKADGGWSPYAIFRQNHQRLGLQGYTDAWVGEEWDGNTIDIDMLTIRLHDATADGAATVTGLTAAKGQWPATFLASNAEASPLFTDPTAGTRAGFALQAGSPGEDEAVKLASVDQDSQGTQVTLDDAWWIYDGFDLQYFGEQGDFIAFYDSTGSTLKGIRQVISVNSQTTITIDSSISIVTGDLVFPVLPDGSTIVHNRGASQ